ncbi:tRNA (adenosine(37)-N6)-dimethylallyltransferase MiaA [Chloroflexota bacterium]
MAIVGPTGVGKSQLALHLAQEFDGEIVSADSRQVYRHMDIGTAKPIPEELSLVSHHLIDIFNPDETFSLAQYHEMACRAIADVQRRHRLPLLVGGSGMYVWSILEGWGIPRVPPNPILRKALQDRAEQGGKEALYQKLMQVDPPAAQRIDPRNVRRTIRALEVHEATGVPFSQLQQKKAPPFVTRIIGLTADREELYRRIDRRVDYMMQRGLVAEVEKLVNMGYDFNLPSMSSIGYKEIGMFLRGELPLDVAVQQTKFETHRFVRHQYNWFRPKDDKIEWFDIQDDMAAKVETRVAAFWKGR